MLIKRLLAPDGTDGGNGGDGTPPAAPAPTNDAFAPDWSGLDKLASEDDDDSDGKPPTDKPADKPPGDTPPTDKPADKPPGDAAPADKPPGDAPPADKPPTPEPDEFDQVELPDRLKPKTAESFANLKRVARERVTALKTELEAAQKALEEAKAGSGKANEEVLKELEEHRQWRAKLDVESSPEFKAFDAKMDSAERLIISTIQGEGMTEEQIKKVKEIGVDKLKWEPLLAEMSPTAANLIRLKLAERVSLQHDKGEAVKTAKENIQQFMEQRDQNSVANLTKEANLMAATVQELMAGKDWLQQKKPKAGATAEEIAALKAHNDKAAKHLGMLKEALGSRAPEMRAMLAVGTLASYVYKDQLDALQASTEKEIKQLKAEKAALEAKLEGVKKSSRTGVLPTDGSTEKKQRDGIFQDGKLISAEQAMDAHFANLQAA